MNSNSWQQGLPHTTHDVVFLQQALQDVIREYNNKTSEIAQLTAELPKRLLMVKRQELGSNIEKPYRTVSNLRGSGNPIFSDNELKLEGPKEVTCVSDEVQSPGLISVPSRRNFTSEEPGFQACKTSRKLTEEDVARAVSNAKRIGTLDMAVAPGEVPRNEEPRVSRVSRVSCVSRFSTRLKKSVQQVISSSVEEEIATTAVTMEHMLQQYRAGQFDSFIGFLIIANCLMMILQSEFSAHEKRVSLGEETDYGRLDDELKVFDISEHVFNAFFVLEMLVRFGWNGRAVLTDRAILMDVFVILCTSVHLYVLMPLGSDGVNFSQLRVLRFVRVIRAFRMVRVLRLFSALRILLNTLVSSFAALINSMVLLSIIMIMSGLFLTELLDDYVNDVEKDVSHRKWVFKYYGTASRAIYTLFEVTFAGCWPNYVRPLIEHVSAWYVLFAVVYISVVVFAIIRIITALFLKETLHVASNDTEMMIQERVRQKRLYVIKLARVFEMVDTSGNGTLSEEEFLQVVSNPSVQTWLQVLDLEISDATALFNLLLDDGTGEVTYDQFLHGIMRLRGQARSMDIVSLMHANEKTLKAIELVQAQLRSVLSDKDPVRHPQAIELKQEKLRSVLRADEDDKDLVRHPKEFSGTVRI